MSVQYCSGCQAVLDHREEDSGMNFKLLYEKQAELNKLSGRNTMGIAEAIKSGRINGPGVWIHDYILATQSELQELMDCLYWKHWTFEAKEGRRYEVRDLQNARVEVIDLFFFWMSLAQCVGLTPEDIQLLYLKKHQVNLDRMKQNYSMDGKTEEDNKGVSL